MKPLTHQNNIGLKIFHRCKYLTIDLKSKRAAAKTNNNVK